MKQQPEILNSWKEISAYLGRGVRTVQRWERDFGLPVRRPAGHLKSSVVALRTDIDQWVANRSQREAAPSQGEGHTDCDRLIKNLQDLVRNLAALNAQQAKLLENRRLTRKMLALRDAATQDIFRVGAVQQENLEALASDLSAPPAA